MNDALTPPKPLMYLDSLVPRMLGDQPYIAEIRLYMGSAAAAKYPYPDRRIATCHPATWEALPADFKAEFEVIPFQ